jgi:hypothetical protein
MNKNSRKLHIRRAKGNAHCPSFIVNLLSHGLFAAISQQADRAETTMNLPVGISTLPYNTRIGGSARPRHYIGWSRDLFIVCGAFSDRTRALGGHRLQPMRQGL